MSQPKILLDTALGGYLCWGCSLPFGPDEPQILIGHGQHIQAVCQDCLDSGEVRIGWTKLGYWAAHE